MMYGNHMHEPLDLYLMHSGCEDGSSSSSVYSEPDMEKESEVEPDQLESNSDSSEDETGVEVDEAAVGWTSPSPYFGIPQRM